MWDYSRGLRCHSVLMPRALPQTCRQTVWRATDAVGWGGGWSAEGPAAIQRVPSTKTPTTVYCPHAPALFLDLPLVCLQDATTIPPELTRCLEHPWLPHGRTTTAASRSQPQLQPLILPGFRLGALNKFARGQSSSRCAWIWGLGLLARAFRGLNCGM